MYKANADRYGHLPLRHAGKSGLVLPPVSLGLWRHYTENDPFADRKKVILAAFDHGVYHFDLADHYGTPYFGSSERLFGRILNNELKPYRDELVISSKVGFEIHDGPFGNGTSRKSILQGIDGTLQRLQTDYVDIYYAHRFDDEVPLEETVRALDDVVRQGKALYIGISNFERPQAQRAIELFNQLGTPLVLDQMSYNMFNRSVETSGLLATLEQSGVGLIAYGPLSEGLLSDRYLKGIPEDFEIHRTNTGTLARGKDVVVAKLNALNAVAADRGQTLSQMALAWLLRKPDVASVIIGTTSVQHLEENLKATENLHFTDEELDEINAILKK